MAFLLTSLEHMNVFPQTLEAWGIQALENAGTSSFSARPGHWRVTTREGRRFGRAERAWPELEASGVGGAHGASGAKSNGRAGQNRFGVPFWRRANLFWGSRLFWYHFGRGELTTHVGLYFSGDWDVHWGYGVLTQGLLAVGEK